MKFSIRKTIAAAAMSTALVATGLAGAGGAAAAPAAPTGDDLIAQRALDGIEPSPQDAADVIGGIEAANRVLTQLGITPFTPTIGACTDFTFPLALGGAMPGPNTPGLGNIQIPRLDVNAVRSGEVLYGFVPVGAFNDAGQNTSGMHAAWFNIDTLEGGIAPMQGFAGLIIDTIVDRSGLPAFLFAPLRASLENTLPTNGARGGIVETDKGTVLSAIFGTVQKTDATCFFFPSLGIATAR